MQNKVIFYYNDPSDGLGLDISSARIPQGVYDLMEGNPVTGASNWGKELYLYGDRYQLQSSAVAKDNFSGKDFLVVSEQALEDGQRLEFFSTDKEYDTYLYCEQRHFAKGDLSGAFSGVKFRGGLDDILKAYDDIMELFLPLRLHMISISCTKNLDGLTAEIQLEYDDYIVEKAYFTEIVNKHPSLRMMAISIPEGKWENWFFFTSGGHSSSIKAEEIRYERTADLDYYWGKSAYFNDENWLLGDFIFTEKAKQLAAFVNPFNWSELLEIPAEYNRKKTQRIYVYDCKYAKKIVLPETITLLGADSFDRCSKLKEVVLPEVTKIARNAFCQCRALKKIVASDKLININEAAFVQCGNFCFDAPEGSYAEKYIRSGKESTKPEFIVKNGVLIKYTGQNSTVIVPEGIREIGETAFNGNKKICEVVLPNSVKILRKRAFYECVNLEKVVLPEGLKTISSNAFYGCALLEEITIPKSVMEIGSYAFFGCKNLTRVVVPEGVTILADSVFSECKKLHDVILPEGITSIEKQAFYNCESLVDIVIPQSVATIGSAAFCGCSVLTEIDIPAGVTTIGCSAFSYCKNLEYVILNNDEILFESRTFVGCAKLADKKKRIIVGNVLFDYLGKEENVVVPAGVTAIGDRIFSSCYNLKSVTVPESVIVIGEYAFPSWNEEFILYAPAGSYAEKYAKEMGINFVAVEFPREKLPKHKAILTPEKAKSLQKIWVTEEQSDGTLMITDYKGSEKEVYIPEQIDGKTVNAIGEYAFSPMKPKRQKVRAAILANITTVVFPATLSVINDNAFQGCEGLTSIEIPEGVLAIGEWAFASCKNVGTASIPQSVKEIRKGAFSDCKRLNSVVLPDGMKEISTWLFYDCKNLTIVCVPDSVTYIGAFALQKCPIVSICASTGSYAETYAKENEINFIAK